MLMIHWLRIANAKKKMHTQMHIGFEGFLVDGPLVEGFIGIAQALKNLLVENFLEQGTLVEGTPNLSSSTPRGSIWSTARGSNSWF